MTGTTDPETSEATSLMAKDQEAPKRRGIDLPMFDEDTGKSCLPAWDNSPIFFVFISFVSLVVLIATMAAQILPFVIEKTTVLQGFLQAFLIVFIALFILSEIEIPWICEHIASLQNWVIRGIMYIFIGLVAFQEAHGVIQYKTVNGKKITPGNIKVLSKFIQISSWAMIAIGVLYFLMGVLCFKNIRDKNRKKVSQTTLPIGGRVVV